MIHWITPDFPLSFTGSGTYRLFMKPAIFDLIDHRGIDSIWIPFERLKYRDLDVDEASDRYLRANVTYPGVVIQMQDGFRLIDGRHRIKKLMSKGFNAGPFYVLSEEDVRPFLQQVQA